MTFVKMQVCKLQVKPGHLQKEKAMVSKQANTQSEPVTSLWLYGRPGSGKTTAAKRGLKDYDPQQILTFEPNGDLLYNVLKAMPAGLTRGPFRNRAVLYLNDTSELDHEGFGSLGAEMFDFLMLVASGSQVWLDGKGSEFDKPFRFEYVVVTTRAPPERMFKFKGFSEGSARELRKRFEMVWKGIIV